jgi:glutamate carboxypeptidase
VTPAGSTTPQALQRLRSRVEAAFDPYLEDLRRLVNVDCGTFVVEGVREVADFMQERFESVGWTTERRPHQPGRGEEQLGDLLVARLRGGRGPEDGGRRILLIGHMDTVFPEGTAAERPFRIDDEAAYGPGVSDMKGGLLAGYYSVQALREEGFEDFASISYVCNPDEEIGSPFSRTAIIELAREADACFVLEGARENGDIVSARKGVRDMRIVYRGRAAHAGVEPERGRSAILQAAHATVALHSLNGRWPGVTVNVGVIHGGTRTNVVPEQCELQVDLRAIDQRTFEEASAEAERVARNVVVPDVTVEVSSRSGFPPMEKTAATARLVEHAQSIAKELGFDVRDALTGGASDANVVAGVGTPVLDGLGPIGGADHAPGEWLDLSSVVPRMALLAGLIASVPVRDRPA